jgi:hypothetical protein
VAVGGMMRALTGQRRVIWHPHIEASNSTLIPAADPSVPAGLPISVDVVRVKTGRDSAPAAQVWTFQVRWRHLIEVGGWACHDPTCPATEHQSFGLGSIINLTSGGVYYRSVLPRLQPVAGWQSLAGVVDMTTVDLKDSSTARGWCSIEQPNTTGLCRWFVAGESVTLTP